MCAIVGYISSKNDGVLTLDKGAAKGQKVRNNKNTLITTADLVSLLNFKSKYN
jgi:hypothetical protein